MEQVKLPEKIQGGEVQLLLRVLDRTQNNRNTQEGGKEENTVADVLRGHGCGKDQKTNEGSETQESSLFKIKGNQAKQTTTKIQKQQGTRKPRLNRSIIESNETQVQNQNPKTMIP